MINYSEKIKNGVKVFVVSVGDSSRTFTVETEAKAAHKHLKDLFMINNLSEEDLTNFHYEDHLLYNDLENVFKQVDSLYHRIGRYMIRSIDSDFALKHYNGLLEDKFVIYLLDIYIPYVLSHYKDQWREGSESNLDSAMLQLLMNHREDFDVVKNIIDNYEEQLQVKQDTNKIKKVQKEQPKPLIYKI